MKNTLLFLVIILFLGSCSTPSGESTIIETPANPAATGFNEADSDPRAIALADSVMIAMGGRTAWDNTRYIGWTFFGRRNLLWDKKEGNVRIDIPADSTVFMVNIFDKKGKALIQGEEVTEADSLAKLMQTAESIWINDAYWLVMPFKLKDSGVTLKYVGQDSTQTGILAEVLALTFDNVGNTPQNKYQVYIDPDSKLIVQWDYFSNATDETPRITTPWADYQRHGEILLSGSRGERGLTNIGVYDEVPSSVFTDFSATFFE
jgi:hypothetical protein